MNNAKRNRKRLERRKVKAFLERSGVMMAEQAEDAATLRNLHREPISKASQRSHKGECRFIRAEAFESGCQLPFAPFKTGKTWIRK